MGTKGDVLLVTVAASLAARAVASSRSIKISANIVVPPLERGRHWAQCSRCRCDGHHEMSLGRECLTSLTVRGVAPILRFPFPETVISNRQAHACERLAGVQDFMLAKATYDAAVKRWPKARIRLCQEARIVEDHDPA